MSEDTTRAHLAAALKIAVEKERVRVDTLLADMDERIQGDVDAMRPAIEALFALAEECRELPGLSIRPAEAIRKVIEFIARHIDSVRRHPLETELPASGS